MFGLALVSTLCGDIVCGLMCVWMFLFGWVVILLFCWGRNAVNGVVLYCIVFVFRLVGFVLID